MKRLNKIVSLMIVMLLFVSGCGSSKSTDGTQEDYEVASKAIQSELSKKPVMLETEFMMNFGIAKEKITATSKAYLNVLEDNTIVVELPKGIDFGSIPVGQLGLENLNKEMIYVFKDDKAWMFVEDEGEEFKDFGLDISSIIDSSLKNNHYDDIEKQLKNFVVTKNGEEVVYSYEIVDEDAIETIKNSLGEDKKLKPEDMQVIMTQSVHILNDELTFLNNNYTIMLDAGKLIGPEAGNIGNITIDMVVSTDFRSEHLIEVPELEIKPKKID